MKLIHQSYEIIQQEHGLEWMYKIIEQAGRVSHKSEHLIQEGSAKKFVDRLVGLGHNSCLEFGTVYLTINGNEYSNFLDGRINWFRNNPYCRVNEDKANGNIYITTNYRLFREEEMLDMLEFITEPTEFHEKRICVKFTCSRAIANQFVRHRKFSFIQESTRYCNYSLEGKFNGVTYIIPNWSTLEDGKYNSNRMIQIHRVIADISKTDDERANAVYALSLYDSESRYNTLIRNGLKPEQARDVLPLCTKTELYMCGFKSDWESFFSLRDDKQHADPMAYELAHNLRKEMGL